MSANVEGLIREAMNAIKAGRKDEGKTFLLKAVELDQYNQQAWLWLSGTMDSADDQRTCLENVLAINPNNERAKQGIEYLAKQPPGGAVYTPPASPLINRATATSVEWDTSPAAPPPSGTWTQQPVAKEPTDADLDAWVSTLNLQTPAQPVKPDAGGATPFTDFNLDDDMFAGGPFGTTAPPVEPPKTASPANARSASPAVSTPPAASTPAKSTPAAATPATPAAPPSGTPAPRSPVPTTLPSFGFDDIDEDADDFLRGNAAKQSGSILYDADADQDGKFHQESEGALFGNIPGTIKPTRLPGTKERPPILLVLASVVLIVVNILAAALLAIGLLSA